VKDIYNPELNADNRTIFCGFKGAFKVSNPDNDPAMDGIYINRRKYLEYGRKECGVHIEGFTINPNQFDQLIYFLKKCNLALNISGCVGDWGFNNERMLLSAMCGCVILHYWYPTIELDGFMDYENCLIFHNKLELKERIEWARSHPVELESIRLNGYNTVKQRYNPTKIVKDQLKTIENYLEALKDPTIKPLDRIKGLSAKKLDEFTDKWYNWFKLYRSDKATIKDEPKLEDI
jgi:hypothetical protein